VVFRLAGRLSQKGERMSEKGPYVERGGHTSLMPAILRLDCAPRRLRESAGALLPTPKVTCSMRCR